MIWPDRPGFRPDRAGQFFGLSGQPGRPTGLWQPCCQNNKVRAIHPSCSLVVMQGNGSNV